MAIGRVRSSFPALRARPDRPSPAYLDSACMSLVPRPVLAAMEEYYREYPGCAGRSLHRFAEEVTHRVEAAREGFARFFGAAGTESVVFVRNATEAINLVAQGIDWNPGDRVLITDREHNSNLVPWHRLARERGIRLEVLPLADDGHYDPTALEDRLALGIRLVSVFQTSNLDGRSLPVREIAERVHDHGGQILVDGCQAAPHQPVDLRTLGADFYALSAHKMLGPTGVGVLLSAPPALEMLRPLLLGGETVERTTVRDYVLKPPPHRFEAGLQNYAGILGAHAGLRFLEGVGRTEVRDHEFRLNRAVTRAFRGESRVQILGPADPALRPSIFAFTVDGIDSHDAALFLDQSRGVLVRSGMHCVHSWYEQRHLAGNVRASFYVYNNRRDVGLLIAGVRELMERIPGSLRPSVAGTAPAAVAVPEPSGTSAP